MSLPSSSPGKQRRNCWLRIGTITKYVTVRSKVGWFAGHWSGKLRRSIRCEGDTCTICASGDRARVFTYVMVQHEGGEVLVWEIPERLFPLAQELDAALFGGVGEVLSIVREGTASNSKLSACIVGREDCEELDIEPFIATLGIRLDTALSHPQVRSESKQERLAVP